MHTSGPKGDDISDFTNTYNAFGLIATTFRELDWQTLIFFDRAVPISPNAWYDHLGLGAQHVLLQADAPAVLRRRIVVSEIDAPNILTIPV